MAIEPEKSRVEVSPGNSVTAMLYAAAKRDRAGVTLTLGHGAGSNQLSGFMRMFAAGLASRGLDVMTFNFLYMEQGRHAPDQKAKLESCYAAVIKFALNHRKLKGNRLIIGGKSMGGRIASQVAADFNKEEGNIAGLVFLGYPLHPPGNPEKLRDAHLIHIKAPMLFIQGARDAFGTSDELRQIIKKHRLPATLHVIEGGDHSFKVPKSSGIPQQQIYESVMDEIAHWLEAK
ncbi:MAG TPA: alpha/beta fold hydrolase [Pyrinomonadaceae bacterium]|jgi:hypothetical protein